MIRWMLVAVVAVGWSWFRVTNVASGPDLGCSVGPDDFN